MGKDSDINSGFIGVAAKGVQLLLPTWLLLLSLFSQHTHPTRVSPSISASSLHGPVPQSHEERWDFRHHTVSAVSEGKAPIVFHVCCDNNRLSKELDEGMIVPQPSRAAHLAWLGAWLPTLPAHLGLAVLVHRLWIAQEKLAADSGASPPPSPQLCSLSQDTAEVA